MSEHKVRERMMAMPTRDSLLGRNEDPFTASFKQMLTVLQNLYDRTGAPDLKIIIDDAHAQLGRAPHRQG